MSQTLPIKKLGSYGLLWAVICFAAPIFAQTISNEADGGYFYLLQKKQHHFFLQNTWLAIDNSVQTTPPDSTVFDRRIETNLLLASQFLLSDAFSFQLISNLFGHVKRIEEQDPPYSPVLSSLYTNKLTLSLGFLAVKGLEIFIGQELVSFLSAKEKKTSDVISSETSYGKSSYRNLKLVIVKRSSSVTSGFYYVMGEKNKVTFNKQASDGSQINGYESLYSPNEYGIAVQLGLSGGMEMSIDAAFIEASANSPRSIRGDRTEDDHYRLKIGHYLPIVFGFLFNQIIYQSPSYAAAAFADNDHTGFTALKSSYLMGSVNQNLQLGVVLGIGEDKTSQVEFNETLKRKALGFLFGLQTSW